MTSTPGKGPARRRTGRPAGPAPLFPSYLPLICFDFDGVLHASPEWLPRMSAIDVTPIHEAHRRGYAAAVMTCNDVVNVARELRRHGIDAFPDVAMSRSGWHGGETGLQVLVTGRKLTARYYVDDRAIHWDFGTSPHLIWAEADRREGFCPCPDGRHWGVYGAAGVLPWTVVDGGICVLLAERSTWGVQEGGTWSTVGGAIDAGETDRDAAFRELDEETDGLDPGECELTLKHVAPCASCGWTYTTYAARWHEFPAARRAKGIHGMEAKSLRWVPLDQVADLKLHTGFARSWPDLEAHLRRQERGLVTPVTSD